MKLLARSLFLLVLFGLAACQVIPGLSAKPAILSGTATANPLTPTPVLGNFIQSPAQACSLADIKTIATSSEQGSLVAWSPDGDKIAYIAPASSHAMFSGALTIGSAPSYLGSNPMALSATGSVTWSPLGDRIAFVGLRSPDNIFTIFNTDLSGVSVIDLFPGRQAKLDDFSSPKAILSWPVEDHLRVQAGCGLGCVKVLEVPSSGGSASEIPTPEPTELAAGWSSARNVRGYDVTAFPKMNDPNWSNDGNKVVYFDDDGYLWVLLVKEKKAFQLEMKGNGLPVTLSETWNRETHWTANGKLAVRVADELELFSIPCNGS